MTARLSGDGRRKGPPLGVLGLGFELMAAVVGATALGLWIDHRYDTGPWGVVVLGLVGIVGGLLNFIRQAKRAAGRDASSSGPPAGGSGP